MEKRIYESPVIEIIETEKIDCLLTSGEGEIPWWSDEE